MEYKNFISGEGWFSVQLPLSWDLDDENSEEGTYLFFDTLGWKGNLRITPIKFSNFFDSEVESNFLIEEYEANRLNDVKKIRVGKYPCVFYQISSEEDNLLTFYWLLQKDNFLFLFSFATDKDKQNEIECEVEKVINLIKSIKTIV